MFTKAEQIENDDADDDLRREHEHAQRELRKGSSVGVAKDGKIPRFFKGYDAPDSTTYDIFYVDRTTGREVLRYDGADPANTNSYYGATPDSDSFARKGFDIKELIDPSQSVILDIKLAQMCHQCDDDDGDYDEGDY